MNHCYHYGQDIAHEHLSELLQRQNNLLENLVQIYKQFNKLNGSHQGHVELNKKICLIECLKCYVEHLILFHRFELLVPPQLNPVGEAVDHTSNRNYLNEMKVNFQIIGNRWRKRREEQSDRLSADRSAYLDANERKYPFTYMIDCLTEECRHNSLVAKYLSRPKTTINENQQPLESFYPPNSIIVTIF